MNDDMNVFHHEFSLVVSSSEVNFHGARAYIQKYVSDLMPRGNYSTSRLLLLSGSHGFADGRDALCDIEALKSMSDDKGEMIPRQTRRFYEAWCRFFKLEVENEDPRVYDEFGQVKEVTTRFTPEWRARRPWLPGMWKKNLIAGCPDKMEEAVILI